jgi:hypothetical protein
MMNVTAQPITFRVILQTPPAGDYGIQKGSGNNYETIQKQRSTGKDLQFEFPVIIKPGKDNTPDFSGAIAQGKPGERFIYIDIGTYAGQQDSVWGRRLKIPLTGIAVTDIKKILAGTNLHLVSKVQGIGKDGGPNCGTVKPFNGWHLSR